MSLSVHTILFSPQGVETRIADGKTVMEAAVQAGIRIERHCGGIGICGKCRILALRGDEFLDPLTQSEKAVLKKEEIEMGVRLACCAIIRRDGTVNVIDIVNESGNRILEGTSERIIGSWDPDREGFGVAVDIGTTTVVCYLLDLEKHQVIGSRSFLNPQVSYGADVISRIAASSSTPETLKIMQKNLVDEIGAAISFLTGSVGAVKEDVTEVVAAGNTVMEHIFLGISPETIGRSPYTPNFLAHPPIAAEDIGLSIAPDGIVKVLPNVAGYVGGDIVAGIASHAVDKEVPIRLLVDIGTNNELVIGNNKEMFCCATAAGPAFEGARISQGMRASTGAIERVKMTDEGVTYRTIGDEFPVGLCGSGLIDAVALLFKENIIDARGRMIAHNECSDKRMKFRLSFDENGMNRFLITNPVRPVFITQKDVREVQLALGAVKAGTEVMMERMGITASDIDEVLLAGAFGSNIDIESAMTIGLLPRTGRDKVHFIYNSSGFGACAALASSDFYDETEITAGRMKYVELSTLPDFQKRFIRSMIFE